MITNLQIMLIGLFFSVLIIIIFSKNRINDLDIFSMQFLKLVGWVCVIGMVSYAFYFRSEVMQQKRNATNEYGMVYEYLEPDNKNIFLYDPLRKEVLDPTGNYERRQHFVSKIWQLIYVGYIGLGIFAFIHRKSLLERWRNSRFKKFIDKRRKEE